MISNLLKNFSILKKFLFINLIFFTIIGLFTFIYIKNVKPNLIKKKSSNHIEVINNTIDNLTRLNINFVEEDIRRFLSSTRFLFQNLDRVIFFDNELNLVGDTDTLDLDPRSFSTRLNIIELETLNEKKSKEITEKKNIIIPLLGLHNVKNATSALSVAFSIGVPSKIIKLGLKNFKGVQRRFNYLFDKNNVSFFDDYAHHPTEITSVLDGVREVYKKRRNVLVDAMSKAGWEIPSPDATMFAWAPIPEKFRSLGSLEFSKVLLKEADISVAPGIGFGEYGENFVRIGLVENEHRIRQAARNIKAVFTKADKILSDHSPN